MVRAVHIPVFGNGDVVDGPSADRLMKETGCAGVAIGRAAWGNPWVFKAVNTYLETGEILPPPTNAMRLSMAREHLHGLVEERENMWQSGKCGLTPAVIFTVFRKRPLFAAPS